MEFFYEYMYYLNYLSITSKDKEVNKEIKELINNINISKQCKMEHLQGELYCLKNNTSEQQTIKDRILVKGKTIITPKAHVEKALNEL